MFYIHNIKIKTWMESDRTHFEAKVNINNMKEEH